MGENMEIKLKTLFSTIGAMFIVGIGSLFLGVAKGYDIAIFLSRPSGASSWTTSQELINAFTYIPIGIGCLLVAIASILLIITLIKVIDIKIK